MSTYQYFYMNTDMRGITSNDDPTENNLTILQFAKLSIVFQLAVLVYGLNLFDLL